MKDWNHRNNFVEGKTCQGFDFETCYLCGHQKSSNFPQTFGSIVELGNDRRNCQLDSYSWARILEVGKEQTTSYFKDLYFLLPLVVFRLNLWLNSIEGMVISFDVFAFKVAEVNWRIWHGEWLRLSGASFCPTAAWPRMHLWHRQILPLQHSHPVQLWSNWSFHTLRTRRWCLFCRARAFSWLHRSSLCLEFQDQV